MVLQQSYQVAIRGHEFDVPWQHAQKGKNQVGFTAQYPGFTAQYHGEAANHSSSRCRL